MFNKRLKGHSWKGFADLAIWRGENSTSSPTSKGLEERMMSPVNRFSKISRPARPTARTPTPPIAKHRVDCTQQVRLISCHADDQQILWHLQVHEQVVQHCSTVQTGLVDLQPMRMC